MSGGVFPRSSSGRSLDERFSQVLLEQMLVQSGQRTSEPVPQLQAAVHREPRPPRFPPRRGPCGSRKSVWTRLGWRTPRRYARGFWSFRNKYGWRARCSAPYRKWRQWRPQLKRGGAFPVRGRGLREFPTKEQLDAELDDYMSLSRSLLDRQLDEYMAMAGQAPPWD